MRQLATLLLFMAVFITHGCGWHLQNQAAMPPQIKTMVFDSSYPNDPLSRIIRNRLSLDNIKLIEKCSLCQNIPLFRVLNSSLSRDTASIFQDGRTAEYRIVLSVDAEILIQENNIYHINTKVYRLFFDNPQTALAKDTEQQIIIKEMYNQAAEQLIRKLHSILIASKDTRAEYSVPPTTPNISTTPSK